MGLTLACQRGQDKGYFMWPKLSRDPFCKRVTRSSSTSSRCFRANKRIVLCCQFCPRATLHSPVLVVFIQRAECGVGVSRHRPVKLSARGGSARDFSLRLGEGHVERDTGTDEESCFWLEEAGPFQQKMPVSCAFLAVSSPLKRKRAGCACKAFGYIWGKRGPLENRS